MKSIAVKSAEGVRLHVLAEGPESGPLMLLLHGFPEQASAWRRQIEHFAGLGYRVLAPDQRGYGLSDKPAGTANYMIDALADDAAAVARAGGAGTGGRKAVLVGHDWGAAVAWWAAGKHADLFERVVIINTPHPMVMKKNLASNPRQLMRSWYIVFFQLPRVPELLLSLGQGAVLAGPLKGRLSSDELEEYRASWRRPGALRGMVNWYRAALRAPAPAVTGGASGAAAAPGSAGGKPRRGVVQIPTLIIWGVRDAYLGRELAEQSLAYCADGKVEWIEDATHWVHHEQPERVSGLIEKFARA